MEAGERILPAFSACLSATAQAALESMGVTDLLKTTVQDVFVRPTGVSIGGQFIETVNVIWAARNRASAILQLPHVLDAAGRVIGAIGEHELWQSSDHYACVGLVVVVRGAYLSSSSDSAIASG